MDYWIKGLYYSIPDMLIVVVLIVAWVLLKKPAKYTGLNRKYRNSRSVWK